MFVNAVVATVLVGGGASAAKRLAEAGVGEYMLMSIMGWTNPTQAKKYIEKASRAKMAKLGMDMLSVEQNKD